MTLKCNQHRKDTIGDCMWCGRKLCELCIAKKEGIKLYCDKCIVHLSRVRRERLPPAMPRPPPSGGRRFVIKNGYLEIQGGD